jgi:hypothetical protein
VAEVKAFDVAALLAAVDQARRDRDLSWRQVGKQTGLGHHVFLRMRTRALSVHALAVILLWLQTTDVAAFLLRDGGRPPATPPDHPM